MQFVCITFVGLVSIHLRSEERQDQLFASWQEAQQTVKSLVVDFTLEVKHGSFDEKAEGTFWLIRTPKGQILASYQLSAPEGSFFSHDLSGLLNNGTVYLLNEKEKIALSLRPIQGDLMQFLEKYFNPFVLLLDRKQAKEKCYLQVVKQDDWYTYLHVTPKSVKRYGWFPDLFHQGRVVLMNKSSEGVPKDMPRELRFTNGFYESIFDIKSWRLNAPDAPKVEVFAKPEDRSGWKVSEWPFLDKTNSAE